MQEMVDSFFYGRPRYDRNARHGLLRQLAHANFGTFAKNIAFFFIGRIGQKYPTILVNRKNSARLFFHLFEIQSRSPKN